MSFQVQYSSTVVCLFSTSKMMSYEYHVRTSTTKLWPSHKNKKKKGKEIANSFYVGLHLR
jgi:hypothetical protein